MDAGRTIASLGSSAEQSFWIERLNQFGHTGWSDPFIYAFDQRERIRLLRTKIPASGGSTGNALDFGCGTGDFCKLLLDLGFTVCGYDPFVSSQIRQSKFSYARIPSEIPFAPGSVDLILSVTVLDHIGDEAELNATLALFRGLLKRDGRFLMLEYALDTNADDWRRRYSNAHQAFRTLDEWRGILDTNSLKIAGVTPFPTPMFAPSQGYRAYSRSFGVRLLRRLSRFPSLWVPRDRILRYYAKKYQKNGSMEDYLASPLKLIECSR